MNDPKKLANPKASPAGEEDADGPPGDRRLAFSDHLDELRSHLLRAVLVIVGIAIVAGIFNDAIATFVMHPFDIAKAKLAARGRDIGPLTYVDITEGFFFYFRMVMYAAVLFGAPYAIYEIWRFVSVGLYPSERRAVMRLVPFSMILFVMGAAFSYFYLLPLSLEILLDYGDPGELRADIRSDSYLGFFIMFSILLGATFQLPLAQIILARFGIISAEQQGKHRKGFIMGATIAAAVLTPTGDPITMMMVAVPMVVLFEIGLLIARRTKRNPRPDEEVAT